MPMDFIKAIDKLNHLRVHEADDLLKYAKVHAIIDGFHAENTTEDGVTANAYDSATIAEVERGFQNLCGLGDDFPAEETRAELALDLERLRQIVGQNHKTLVSKY